MEARIEAALYAAGRPLTIEELTKAAGITSKRKALAAARAISARVNQVLKAMRIVEQEGQRFVMELKSEYNPVAKKFATRSLIPNSVLKTLSYLVYYQPVTSHDLAMRRGSQVYSHLKMLEEIGFVKSEQYGRTRIYRSTQIFAQHFGLSLDVELMKHQLANYRAKGPPKSEYEPELNQHIEMGGAKR